MFSSEYRLVPLSWRTIRMQTLRTGHLKVVSERLGHASVTLTLDTYSHVLPTMQEAAAEKLERILFKRSRAQ